MKKNILKNCPVCGEELTISKLKCISCDMEYSGNFQTSLISGLNDTETEFILLFLKNEGNISKMQNEIGRTYASIKAILSEINLKLGLIKEKKESVDMKIFANNNVTGVIKAIQDKFIECGGKSKMKMLKGEPLDIWVAPSGEGVENSGFTQLVCEWHILEAIVKKANELGGVMYRGDSAAQNGAKIGSKELPLDTIDAFISLEFYGAKEGASTLRRSTYYAAILAWAGIVENNRSKGNGGYIVVKPEYRK
jgi:hypothetical protein